MKDIDVIPAKLKHKVEDFIVEEIGEKWETKISENFNPNVGTNLENLDIYTPKEFLCCEMEKQDLDHFSTIKDI
jgi:hypothetical protein